MDYNNISSIYLNGNEKIDLLIFKADIQRKDTISTQVEYQFYSLIPEYIYIKIDINEYLNIKNKNNLKNENISNINNEYEYIYLDLPINWPKEVLENILELIKANINPFNSSSEFYLDVCNKYTTPTNDDIYLQERKEKYYPDELFCEENCEFIKFNLDNYKITCKCKPKNNTNDYEKILFKYNYKDEEFIKRFTSPNLKAMKCKFVISKTLNKNFGFFFTFILLFIFFVFFILALINKNENKENIVPDGSSIYSFSEQVDIKSSVTNTSEKQSQKSSENQPNNQLISREHSINSSLHSSEVEKSVKTEVLNPEIINVKKNLSQFRVLYIKVIFLLKSVNKLEIKILIRKKI